MSPNTTFTRCITLILAATILLPTALALPTPQGHGLSNIAAKLSKWLRDVQAGTLPPASSLPGLLEGVQLKYIALGVGTQNYTCATSTADSVPVAIGATATLYDATAAMVATSNSPLARMPRAMAEGPCQADQHNTAPPLPLLGDHYFDNAGVPTFDLRSASMLLKAKKMATAVAPTDACPGRDGGLAVPWLMLQEDGTGRSEGLSQVFRVETAGGSAPSTCKGVEGHVERDYAAYYYLYGL